MIRNTLNPNDKGKNIVLASDNLTVSVSDKNDCTSNGIRGNNKISKGKWFFEVYCPVLEFQMIGVATKDVIDFNMGQLTPRTGIRGYESYRGYKLDDGFVNFTTADKTPNQYIGVAVDTINGTLGFMKNGANLGIVFTDLNKYVDIYPFIGLYGASNNGTTINFGKTPFVNPVPSGYMPLDGRYKFLIKQNNQYYTFNSTNIIQSQSQTLDENNFKTNGFDDPTIISEKIWNDAFPDKTDLKVLLWTDDLSKTDASMGYSCEPFKPIDKLADEFQIMKFEME